MLPNFAWQHAYLQRPGVATRPSRTSRSNTPSLLSRVQLLKREVEKSAELGQASMTVRNTRHPLRGNAPVRGQRTRCGATHPLGGNTPVQKGCNAYGSGVAPRDTSINAETAGTSDATTAPRTPPWRAALRWSKACGHQLHLMRRAWSWRTTSQRKSPELHWCGVTTGRYSEAREPCG